MIRYTRHDAPNLPWPVYELTAERIGPDVRVAVMVGGGQVNSIEEFSLSEESGECIGLATCLETMPYAAPDDAAWMERQAASVVVSRVG